MLNLLRGVAVFLAIGCAVFMIRTGEPANLWWWPWISFLYLWNVSPLGVALIAATKVRRAPFIALMMGYMLMSAVTAAWLCHDAFLISNDPTAGIIFLFLPVYEWGTLIVVIMIATAVGWFGEA